MKKYIIFTLLIIITNCLFTQSVYIDWQQCYGGTNTDYGLSIGLLENGHFIVLSASKSSDIDVSINKGGIDFWLFETDALGNIIWEKTYGGSENDVPIKLMLAAGGGFVLFGETWSNNGDVSGNHGGDDYWLVKTDSLGNLVWQRCLGSSMNNIPSDMDMDEEGNIYVMGLSLGIGGDVTASNGFYDYWFAKISSEGVLIWDKNLGGTYTDNGLSITSTYDGGVIVGGIINDTDGDITCNTEPWNKTGWVVKLDSLNNIEWQQCYNGTYTESIVQIKTTSDGGYILLGLTNSNDGDVSGFHGVPGQNDNTDLWVIKTDSLGIIEWQRCLGGTDDDNPEFVKITPDNNYIIGGMTTSDNGDVSGNHSIGDYFYDQWIVKLDSQGEIVWQQCIGSTLSNILHDAIILSESELIAIGSTYINNNGDVLCDYKGDGDVWLYKLIDTTVSINESELLNKAVKIYPNPANSVINIDFIDNFDLNNTTVEIIDVSGTILQTAKPLSNSFQLDISKLSKGLYLVKIQVDRSLTTKCIVKN